MPKENNTHKYPYANHQPRHKAAERIGRAEARQEAYDELTLEQKIARLPPEPAAQKQRARLLALLETRNTPKPEPQKTMLPKQEVATETVKEQFKPKNYMKGAK